MISFLENFASRGYRDQLLASATGFGLLPSLTKVARKKNTSIQLQTKIIHVVSSLLGQVRANLQVCSGSDKSSNDHAGYQNMIDNLPPVSLFKEVLPLLNVLIETKDNEVRPCFCNKYNDLLKFINYPFSLLYF